MYSVFKFGFLILCINALAVQISGETFLLDEESSATPFWIGTDCYYSVNYMDNWPYGCKTAPAVDIFPTSKGYWTHCKPKTCEFEISPGYDGISTLKIKNYIEGKGKIIVNITNSAPPNTITEISAPSTKDWVNTDVDISHQAKSIIITLTAPDNLPGEGFALIDSISVETGNSASTAVHAQLFCLLSGLTALLTIF